jgi:hypothetical protein
MVGKVDIEEPLYLHSYRNISTVFNPLNAELNPICCLLSLLGAHPIFHVSRMRVKFRMIMWTVYVQQMWEVKKSYKNSV